MTWDIPQMTLSWGQKDEPMRRPQNGSSPKIAKAPNKQEHSPARMGCWSLSNQGAKNCFLVETNPPINGISISCFA